MENLIEFVLLLSIPFFLGVFFHRKIYKNRYEENLRNVKNEFIIKEVARSEEHKRSMDALSKLIEDARGQSKSILSKAVDYAFSFKEEIASQHETAQKEIQRVLDDSYRFKRKSILSSITLKNYERKFEELKNERKIYLSLIAKRSFFSLSDNSDWDCVEREFKGKVSLLKEAQAERESQAEIKRMMHEEQARAEQLEKEQSEAIKQEALLKERQAEIETALLEAGSEHRKQLEDLRAKLMGEIEEVHKRYERAKSMAQLTKQGHVYVISNIGSFGSDVFKVGMTRRLEPMDRVHELGDASVPFSFDVHAMINCDDAPALESALHNELVDYRMNKVNLRKEFFKVDLETILDSVKKHHGEIEYVANPMAIEYNRSLELEMS